MVLNIIVKRESVNVWDLIAIKLTALGRKEEGTRKIRQYIVAL